MAPPPFKRPPVKKDDGPRVNRQIQADKVRFIDENGDMIGVLPLREAIQRAEEAGLDLVEVSPNAEPPVCKAIDYGKYKYEMQKKAAEARKKQKVIEIKELKMRPTIDPHDLETKLKAANRFLDDGDKVKFTVRFRGRETSHSELGLAVLNKIREALAERIKVEAEPRLEGRQMMMIVSLK